MATRRVLIVDDSKTAQIRLRKMLEQYDLDVDTVMSAEEALGYLSYRQPDIIFLDHHMEGMDGLEALKIIKSNPSTALIPVIMYTSEQGDVYVGQARALGAIDIIGKEVIKQDNLEKVLRSLGIGEMVSKRASATTTDKAAVSKASEKKSTGRTTLPHLTYSQFDEPEPEAISDSSDIDKVQKQISKLFEIHIAKVRQEIEDNTKFLLRRLARESADKLKPAKASVAPQVMEPPVVDTAVDEYTTADSSGGPVSAVLLGIILLGIAFLGYHLYINNQHQELRGQQYNELIVRTRAQEELINNLFQRVNESSSSLSQAQAYADRQVLLDSLSWAVNVDTRVAYGDQALNDQRIYMLGELLALLSAANFNGQVYLDVHLGNFCVVEDLSGSLILPDAESNLEDCRLLADRQLDIALDDQVSVGFLNYMNSAPILTEGNIAVEMAALGYSEPRVSYPPATSATSAGEWNEAAFKNNRIAITFAAD